jgi:hypothetical protein
VREVWLGGGGAMRLGSAGDDHVRVCGAGVLSVCEAALERGEGERIVRHRMWSATEPDRSRCGVDVVDGERAQLADRRAVQQREQSDERLVRVTLSARPSAQQPCLLVTGEGAAAEAAGGSVLEIGSVRQIRSLRANAKKSRSAANRKSRSPDDRNVSMCAHEQVAQSSTPLLIEVGGERGEDREPLLDRVVCQRPLADPPGALAAGQQPGRVSLGHGAQRLRATLDPPRASSVREPAALVAGERQAAVDEKRFEKSRGVAGAAARASFI